MEIVRTQVLNATAPNGQAILRVLFCGQGNECVTVDMANVEGDEEIVLVRAKAILVQTATFGLASNDYDGTSNGNFDEVSVTSVKEAAGDVYVFDYRDGETSRRIPPSHMPSFDAARAEAIRCAVDLLVDLEPGTDDLSGWLVRVSDEQGELLYTVDVQEAEAARQASQ
ncbi:hypothetical protein MesoLj113a_64710 [Mesorhizobium sp. 113-1-2]|uniref:DUF6894 family protein n=1 Tax=Mesorhizobium sp. 113-1-2 TaxID=2744515 RepID=UPI0008197D8C|nr:hypothetical protein [Mesorhizobium sp. 113-1-2]BAV51009.1 Uncharacterized protein MLTONO_6107 [Mesorhizobium loti]BCG75313.1 hypothetical protein MesoLj113a_64710 [Mesorhizobium sp. 113-1-2]